MKVVWDPAKAKANFLKHGIRFSDAEGVLYDPMALTREDEKSEGERRFISIGLDHLTRLVGRGFRGTPRFSSNCVGAKGVEKGTATICAKNTILVGHGREPSSNSPARPE